MINNAHFLKNIIGSNKIVCSKSLFTPNGGMKEIDKNQISFHNNQGKDIYFVVNPGGTKSSETTHLQTIYVDVDAGRDANNNYYKANIVKKFKSKVKAKISQLKLKPSYVVETRNGFQIYYKITKMVNTPSNLEKYKILQTKLYNTFSEHGADNKVQKINQLLRFPGYFWQKKWEKLPSFMVNVDSLLSSGKTYTLNQFSLAFKDESVTKAKVSKNYKPSYSKYTDIDKTNQSKAKAESGYSKMNTDSDTSSIIDTCDFLEEVSKILFYSNHKFLSKQALELVQKLKTEITLV